MYGHRISGRMDLLLGAGPQLTFIDTQGAVCSDPTVPVLLLYGLGGHAWFYDDQEHESLASRPRLGCATSFTKRVGDLSYERFETSGSGLFAGTAK